ncbi:hypothetical protein HA399_17395 (plasmid) [Cobetia sp. UIB-001]|uniref:hypothetical protein n=1 Tax=Cobetia sp. UIB-001 TaxID=2717697 RepID=UPI00384E9A64
MISKYAESCPKCGAPNKKPSSFKELDDESKEITKDLHWAIRFPLRVILTLFSLTFSVSIVLLIPYFIGSFIFYFDKNFEKLPSGIIGIAIHMTEPYKELYQTIFG